MKTLPLLLCLFYCHIFVAQASSIESFAEKVDFSVENVTKCIEHSGVTTDGLEEFQKQGNENDGIYGPEDLKKFGCFWACLLQQQGVMTGSTINSDLMAKYIRTLEGKFDVLEANSDLDKVVEDCANSGKDIDDECEAILNFHMCTSKFRHL
ncbi:odorant binding protein 12 [Colletes latitarsis]|uniref:odorant binding protein 12 n=1 Tax=Colletes latitarsis TaxID=2605962 RepID=UPI00403718E6